LVAHRGKPKIISFRKLKIADANRVHTQNLKGIDQQTDEHNQKGK